MIWDALRLFLTALFFTPVLLAGFALGFYINDVVRAYLSRRKGGVIATGSCKADCEPWELEYSAAWEAWEVAEDKNSLRLDEPYLAERVSYQPWAVLKPDVSFS